MDADLKTLEEKIAQTVQLCQHLRAENNQLRQELAAARDENKRINDKITGATTRLETLLQQIPEVAEE